MWDKENLITELINLVDRLTGLGGNLADNMVVAIMLEAYQGLEARPKEDPFCEYLQNLLSPQFVHAKPFFSINKNILDI